MVLRKLMGILTITLIVGAASLAMAGIPVADRCIVSWEDDTVEHTLVLMNVPDGSGRAFDACRRLAHEGFVDGRIKVLVRDSADVPIVNYPAEDVTLRSATMDTMIICVGGATADYDTDDSGYTWFETPLHAGGWSEDVTQIIVNNNIVPETMALMHNSPDINGDGVVNLSDVSKFATDYYLYRDFDIYHFKADFYYDGEINLSDIPRLAAAKTAGAACP